ncbi:MAG: NUDIX hydrolase [bacterium]|nr:NUDIX hydrolase [bacterium]MCY4163967.1 NUDIX hydrolase [bacterium]MCY4256819.1 NUDIX hydrolase [bacterium]
MAIILGGGGLITRQLSGGADKDALEVLLVHRCKHQDWSLPAGKLDPGEDLAECALREVFEETGFVCELGRELGAVDYVDRRGRLRQMYYWEMDAISGSFSATPEVDAIKWIPLRDALEHLSHPRDLEILSAFFALAGDSILT